VREKRETPEAESIVSPFVQEQYLLGWHNRTIRPWPPQELAERPFGEIAPTPERPPVTADLVSDRVAGPRRDWAAETFDWGPDAAGHLAALAAEAGVSRPVVALTAVQALLHLHTASPLVVVLVPRRASETGTVRASETGTAVGPLQAVPVCTDFSGAPAFSEVLARTDRSVREAQEHPHRLPTEAARLLGGDRGPALLLVNEVAAALTPSPVRLVERLRTASGLVVNLDITDAGVTGFLAYGGDVFEPESARRLLEQLRSLLARGAEHSDRPISELVLEPVEAVGDPELVATPPPVHRGIRAVARQWPEAAAVVTEASTLSYRELCDQASWVMGLLQELGPVAGRPVAIRLSPGPTQVAALLGALEAGAVLVCMAPGDPGERGRTVLADLRPTCLVVEGDQDGLAAWYRGAGGQVLDLEGPLGRRRGSGAEGGRKAEPAYIAYTSGSTGTPKGIPQDHATLAQFAGWFATEFDIGPGSRVAQWAAPGYDAALGEIFAALTAGATLLPVPSRVRPDPERLARWLHEERITLFQTVPSFARELLKVLRRPHSVCPDELEHLLLAGEVLPAELSNGLRQVLPSTRLVNLYGPTESILATWHEVSGVQRDPVPIGRPIPGRQVLVVDDQDRPCATGVTGQIVVRGAHVSSGYIADSDRDAFRPLRGTVDGPDVRTFRTGDLGRWRWDGTLEFRGRRDARVKFYGTRLELTDLEAVLAEHPSVQECAVTAISRTDGLAERLVAHVVPAAGADPSAVGEESWRLHLRHRFGAAMPPVSFTTLDRLPRNLGGKVDRHRLSDPRAARATTA
jgi:(S)-beta-tyrosine adenylation enzyme